MATTNKLILGVSSLAIVAMIAVAGSAVVSADNGNGEGKEGLVQKIAAKFGVSEDEVKGVFQEHKQEKRSAHLDSAVEAGTITEEQKNQITAKHDELKATAGDMSDKTREERREVKKQHMEEFKAWAEENNIPLDDLKPERGGRGGPGGHHRGGFGSERPGQTEQQTN